MVVDEQGLGALTIRRVAERVGTPPMSLYAHFSNKNQLLDLMYEELAGRLYRDQGYEQWQTEMLALCQRIRTILLAHPNWAPLISRPNRPLAIPLRERILPLIVASGASSEQAFSALSSCVLMSIGFALVELNFQGPDGESALERRFERLKSWVDTQDAHGHRATREALKHLPRFSLDEVFEFSAHALIAGIERSAQRR